MEGSERYNMVIPPHPLASGTAVYFVPHAKGK